MKKLISILAAVIFISSLGLGLGWTADDGAIILTERRIEGTEIERLEIVEPVPIFLGQRITVREGWNLIAMPVLPDPQCTITQFIELIEGPVPIIMVPPELRASWSVPVVAVYKDGKFKTYNRETGNYNMVPGEAYFVYAKGPEVHPIDGLLPFPDKISIYIPGKIPRLPVSLNLSKGWTAAAVSGGTIDDEEGMLKGKPRCYIISKLIAELHAQTSATRLIFWNAEKQAWEQHDLTIKDNAEQTAIVDRALELYEGFFVACNSNGLYIPTLNDVKEGQDDSKLPPFPPVPEVRKKYSGKIEGVMHIPEEVIPFTHAIITANGEMVSLKGKTEAMEQLLAKAAQTQETYDVEGVMVKLMSDSMSGFLRAHDVLVVDYINPYPAGEIPMELYRE